MAQWRGRPLIWCRRYWTTLDFSGKARRRGIAPVLSLHKESAESRKLPPIAESTENDHRLRNSADSLSVLYAVVTDEKCPVHATAAGMKDRGSVGDHLRMLWQRREVWDVVPGALMSVGPSNSDLA
jgi:hypothetical protein